MDVWEPGFNGFTTPYTMGWDHGMVDSGQGRVPRPGVYMSEEDWNSYQQGYDDAYSGDCPLDPHDKVNQDVRRDVWDWCL